MVIHGSFALLFTTTNDDFLCVFFLKFFQIKICDMFIQSLNIYNLYKFSLCIIATPKKKETLQQTTTLSLCDFVCLSVCQPCLVVIFIISKGRRGDNSPFIEFSFYFFVYTHRPLVALNLVILLTSLNIIQKI